MPIHFHFGENITDLPVGVQDVSGTCDTHHPLPIKILFLPHAIGFQHLVSGIAGQGKIELVFIPKLLQLGYSITTYSQNLGSEFIQFFFGITELVRLARSTGSIRLGKEK